MNKSQVSSYFSALGKMGGKKKWSKIKKAQRSEMMRKVAQQRYNKVIPFSKKDA